MKPTAVREGCGAGVTNITADRALRGLCLAPRNGGHVWRGRRGPRAALNTPPRVFPFPEPALAPEKGGQVWLGCGQHGPQAGPLLASHHGLGASGPRRGAAEQGFPSLDPARAALPGGHPLLP